MLLVVVCMLFVRLFFTVSLTISPEIRLVFVPTLRGCFGVVAGVVVTKSAKFERTFLFGAVKMQFRHIAQFQTCKFGENRESKKQGLTFRAECGIISLKKLY